MRVASGDTRPVRRSDELPISQERYVSGLMAIQQRDTNIYNM